MHRKKQSIHAGMCAAASLTALQSARRVQPETANETSVKRINALPIGKRTKRYVDHQDRNDPASCGDVGTKCAESEPTSPQDL
jgi:hypothetical protein